MDKNTFKESLFNEAMEIQQEGYNCAETVMKMAGKYYIGEMSVDHGHIVTGFGGGIGRSRDEACGALTGAVVAMSILFGRSDCEIDVDPTHKVVSDFRDRFLNKFGNTICGKLRHGYEGDEARSMCHNMTAETVVMLHDYFLELGVELKN
jgi:C_GCAxxG_C_C family probable redox protein